MMLRGVIALNPYNNDEKKPFKLDNVFKWWEKAIVEAKKTPLFPLERFSDYLKLLVPLAGNNTRFIKLTEQVEELLLGRKNGIAAEKCYEMAKTYYDSGQLLLSIKHLHKSKIYWFTAETLAASLHTMLLISHCYKELGLLYAAKYYAAASIVIIHNSPNTDELKSIMPQAFFILAECCYVLGEWVTFMQMLELVIKAHALLDPNPLNVNVHEELKRLFIQAYKIHTMAKDSNLDILKFIENKFDELLQAQELKIIMNGLCKGVSNNELQQKVFQELYGVPFADLQKVRNIQWKALGINWLVEFENHYKLTAITEGFVAVTQIILAELIEYDFCLLPINVHIILNLTKDGSYFVQELPNNNTARFELFIPESWLELSQTNTQFSDNIFAIIGAILWKCSLLREEVFRKKITQIIKDGIFTKTFIGRPYHECFFEIITEEGFKLIDNYPNSQITLPKDFNSFEHAALAWKDTQGPGYSSKKAKEFLKNRYKVSIRPIRLTLQKMLKQESFKESIRQLKREGFLDWQIVLLLANLAIRYRMEKEKKLFKVKESFQEESPNDIEIPVEFFCDENINLQKRILTISVLKTWGLEFKSKNPDFNAVKKFLDVRYNHSSDDIKHEDFFGAL